MAVTEVKIRPGSPRMQLDTNNGRQGARATVNYRVKTDSRYLPAALYRDAVAFQGGPNRIPERYDRYRIETWDGAAWVVDDFDDGIYCREIDVRKDPAEPQTFWLIDATFRTLDQGQSVQDTTDDPIARPPKFWIEFREETRVVEKAWNLDNHVDVNSFLVRAANTEGPIATTIGEDYDQTLVKPKNTLVLAMEKNVPTLQHIVTLHQTYDDTLNSNTYYGYPPMHARFEGVSSSREETENDFTYFRTVVRVAFSQDGFTRDVVNRGWRYFPEAQLIASNWDGASPINLNANGTKKGEDEIGEFVRYRDRRLVNYATLLT